MSITLRLNCLIDGEDIVFPVTATCDDEVSDLKESIQKRRALGTLQGVDPYTLEVWKLKDSNPIAAEPDNSLVERIGVLGSDFLKFADKLGPTKTVFSIFPTQPPRGYIHIIVKCPRTPISASGSNESNASSVSSTGDLADQKVPSDHPLHELWMLAREPGSTLFERRPVQRDQSTNTNLPLNCMVLKGGDWVEHLQPDSLLTGVLIRDEYVEALKAMIKWFLREKEATEDAMEVDDIEPAPFEDLFLKVRGLVSKHWAFVLLGDPGIGKTVFLYFLLVLRLQARLPTIYQSRDTHLYYFAEDGVYLINLIPSPIAIKARSRFHKSTWCLIDSNQSLDSVPVFIQDLNLFIVQASSPRPHRYAWIDKRKRPVVRYFMKSWTLPELLVGRVLQDEVLSETQIEFFSTRYGTQARSVYINASDPLIYETSLLEKMASITYEGMGKLFRETLPLDLGGVVSHQLVTISPGVTRHSFQSTFPTRYVYEKFRDGFSTRKLEAAARLYEIFVRNPNTKVPAGYMLEDAVNDVFFRGGEWSVVPLRRSSRTGSKCIHWKNPTGQITPQYLHLGYLGRHIAIDTTPHPVGTVYAPLPLKCFLPDEQLQLVDGYYYPDSGSQETFDAFIYESATNTATIIQVTTATTHSVKEGGVNWLRSLNVTRFRYIAVTTPDTSIDLPFPNEWNTPRPLIPEKYLLTVDSLPEH